MNQEPSPFGIALGMATVIAELVAVGGSAFLVVHRIWPRESWLATLRVVWWSVLVCAVGALAVLVYRHFSISPADSTERLGTYVWAIILSPIVVSGVLVLFLKPR